MKITEIRDAFKRMFAEVATKNNRYAPEVMKEIFPVIDNAVAVDCSTITLLAREDEIVGKDIKEIIVGARLPFKNMIIQMDFWTEQSITPNLRYKYFLLMERRVQNNDTFDENMFVVDMYGMGYDSTGGNYRYIPICCQAHLDKEGNTTIDGFTVMSFYEDVWNQLEGNEDLQNNMVQAFHWACYHISVLNCKSVKMVRNTARLKDGISRKSRIRFYHNSYYVLEIDGVDRAMLSNPVKSGIQNRYHLCRGHFKLTNNLFGRGINKRIWWTPHMRGHRELGEIKKDYKVA